MSDRDNNKIIECFSVKRLNSLSKHYPLLCYGCGKQFSNIIQIYRHEDFLKRTEGIFDSSTSVQGKEINIGKRKLHVLPPDCILDLPKKKYIFMITSDRYEEILKTIRALNPSAEFILTKYPMYYSKITVFFIKLLSFFPVRRALIFRAGNEPHENADAVSEYLLHRYKGRKYKIIYVGEYEKRVSKRNGIIYLDINTLKKRNRIIDIICYCAIYSSAGWLLYENEALKRVRREQRIINMNHGTIPLKYVADVLKQPDYVNYSICPAKGCAQIYNEQYSIPFDRLIYLMPPRTSFIFEEKDEVTEMLDSKNMQVLLWLPTFRSLKDTNRTDTANLDAWSAFWDSRFFCAVNKTLQSNKQLLAIKFHPRENIARRLPAEFSNIILLSDEDIGIKGITIQHFLGKADALLTDYSGIAFEYMLLDRPIGYVIPDIEFYERGFVFDEPFEYMPGDKIKTLDELIVFLDTVKAGNDNFRTERRRIVNKLFGNADPRNGAELLIKFINGG